MELHLCERWTSHPGPILFGTFWWESLTKTLHTGLEKDVVKSQLQHRTDALLGSPQVMAGLIVTFLAVMAKDLHPVLTCLTLRQAEGCLPNQPPLALIVVLMALLFEADPLAYRGECHYVVF